MPVDFDWQRQDPSDFDPPDPGPFPWEDEGYEPPCFRCGCVPCDCDGIYERAVGK